jgi:hypothetical protein
MELCFSLTTNQPTMFFSQLISTVERVKDSGYKNGARERQEWSKGFRVQEWSKGEARTAFREEGRRITESGTG